LTTKLSNRARDFPILAWQEIVKTWTGDEKPLLFSLLNPNFVEVFFDPKTAPSLLTRLPASVQHVATFTPSEKDVHRRAKAYLNGYFKTLRLATLNDLPQQLRLDVLVEAERLLGTPRYSNRTQFRKQWKATITFDRDQIVGSTSSSTAMDTADQAEKLM
jgi:hypothetical protein